MREGPLNPTLYNNLERIFGHVRISSEGIEFSGRYVPSLIGGGDELSLTCPGEYYMVCCDCCADTRFRLYVNHRWGVRDERGRRNLWLAVCYNEGCYSNYFNRERLFDRVQGRAGEVRVQNLRRGRPAPPFPVEVLPPGMIRNVADLPDDHPANAYLRERFIDPAFVGRCYGVGYCADSPFHMARDKIYIPVYSGGKLKGWQMRVIGDVAPDSRSPKYWTCPEMARGQLIYNYDAAVKFRTGVVMEGATNIWELGPQGMGTLGFPMTAPQGRQLAAGFEDHALVLLFDPDVLEREKLRVKYESIVSDLSGRFRRGLAAVKLPHGTDPADWERGFLRRYVEREAKAQGVTVSWERR